MRASFLVAAAGLLFAAPIRSQCSAPVQSLIDDRQFEQASVEVQSSLRKNPGDDAALHCMGRILVAQNNGGDAIEWFEKAVKANDRSAVHHLWLGNAIGEQAQHASKLKQPFMARRIKSEFERAVELDPSSIDARHGLIQFYSQAPGVMGGSMDKAKDQAREIAKLNAWRGHVEMAQLLERDKDMAGAEKEYRAAAAAAPDTNAAQNTLGTFLRRQKRYDEALAVYEDLLKRKPDAVGAHLNIAYTLYQANRSPDRVERETRAWLGAAPPDAPKPNFSVAHFLLGEVAEKQGKKDLARSEYEQAVTLNPANAEAKRALEGLR
jgi:Tfp pilus assembly protein PilF